VYSVYWKIDIFLDHNVQESEKFEDTKGVIRSVIEKGLTTQWPNEKGQTDRQDTTQKTKDQDSL